MELKQLRTFIAVAEELNFRRAAQRLNLALPALNQDLQDLEQSIGVRLLDQSTNRVQLSTAGEVFLTEARQLLVLTEHARASAQSAARGERGTLRIGNIGTLSHSFIPGCLDAFRLEFPEVDVSLVELAVEDHIPALRSGDIQIGFSPLGAQHLPAGFAHLVVLQTQLRLAMSRSHHLTRVHRISLLDLNEEPLLFFSDSRSVGPAEHVLPILAERRVKVGPVQVVKGYEAFLATLARGEGISFLPRMPGESLLDALTTRSLKESVPELGFELLAIWRKKEVSPLVQNFLAVLRSSFEKTLWRLNALRRVA